MAPQKVRHLQSRLQVPWTTETTNVHASIVPPSDRSKPKEFCMAISCSAFADYISRKVEHLDENIILSMHPLDSQWVGHVSTGRFPAEQGIEHTFDRFENVFPKLGAWNDVQSASCVGAPCDPASHKIGLGFTRDSYKLQQTAYETDLFCWDLILSADRATQQFAHFVRVLRRISTIVWSYRFRTEALRIAKYRWVLSNNGLTAVTATWDATMTQLTLTPTVAGTSAMPTSKLGARHLQRRVDPQIRAGAEGPTINKNMQPMLELVTNMETVWGLVEGDSNLTDHWRFQSFTDAAKYYKYGWTGSVGNFGLRSDAFSLRFNIISSNAATGVVVLGVVFPYTNIAATEGIKEDVNSDYDNAGVQADFIWHRKAMTSLVRDAKAINPEMPFAARDFAGKWQFVMDNLTCGTMDVLDATTGITRTIPIAVNNERRNKGKFITDFGGAIKAEYPELAEVFISLREPACIVDIPTCTPYPSPYPYQHYESANAVCSTSPTQYTIVQVPIINSGTSTYEVPENSILCNGMPIVGPAITGSTTVALLVAELNTKYAAMGTWTVSGGTSIQLVGASCSSMNIPWQDSP